VKEILNLLAIVNETPLNEMVSGKSVKVLLLDCAQRVFG